MALPPHLSAFLELYNAGSFFEAHEVLEEEWLQSRNQLYRGLIILAAAFCKRDRGNPAGIIRNLQKARRRLETPAATAAAQRLGIPVDTILAAIDQRLDKLHRAGFGLGGGMGDGQISPHILKELCPDLPLHPGASSCH